MEFLEDLMVDFVKSKNRKVTEKDSYLSGTGTGVVTINTVFGEVWQFIGGKEIRMTSRGSRGERYNMPAASKRETRNWRVFAIDRTFGFQRDTMTTQFINDARVEFLEKIEELCDSDNLCKKVETFADEELKHLMLLEEKKFSLGLNSCKTAFDFNTVRQGVWVNRSYYGKEVQDLISYLLDNVQRGFSDNGEEVFNFTPIQFQHYERLKDIAETIDSTMRYQIYRADQAELHAGVEQSEN